MLRIPEVVGKTFGDPTTFYTFYEGNPRSVRTLKAIEARCQAKQKTVACIVLGPGEKLAEKETAVAVFDSSSSHTGKQFTHVTSLRQRQNMPVWAAGSHWGVQIEHGCEMAKKEDERRYERAAKQLVADFILNFRDNLNTGYFPWGPRKKNEPPPQQVVMDSDMIMRVVGALNSGPDLAAAIAHQSFASELPKDSKISWLRVLEKPIGVDKTVLTSAVFAMKAFETACGELVRERPDLHNHVLAGVDLADDARLRSFYLHPMADQFSVARPDFHYGGESDLYASENDEMPGGMPELVHLDTVYGLNEERWQRCFKWLCSRGTLLFLVSHDWSKCYTNETRWLVEHLKRLGYPAKMTTTAPDDLRHLDVHPDMVFHCGDRIGTVWRQFPIFETSGALVNLVDTARRGGVRMFPEFAHYGNKVWFSLFWDEQEWFGRHVAPVHFERLQKIIPQSHLVLDENSFPLNLSGTSLDSLSVLRNAPDSIRGDYVLKVCGANTKAARSQGVLMGHGIKGDVWGNWIDERMAASQPFIIQKMFPTAVAQVPVYHTGQKRAEVFPCRILLRPWVMDGEVVSVHACAAPYTTRKVHGMVDMAIAPVQLE